MNATPETRKSLGVAACTAIVVGNMVGSGFYLSPAAVAPYGMLAVVAWIVMGAGAICLGLTFARLARAAPATGGPYAYTRMAYPPTHPTSNAPQQQQNAQTQRSNYDRAYSACLEGRGYTVK